jgi:hypothetical protein
MCLLKFFLTFISLKLLVFISSNSANYDDNYQNYLNVIKPKFI